MSDTKELSHPIIEDGEPCFILRASDINAPAVVQKWAALAEYCGVAQDKVDEARRCAYSMRAWSFIGGPFEAHRKTAE